MREGFLPAHGGQLRELAAEFGVPEASLLDFSASIHPLPPSDALVSTLCDAIRARKTLTTYPDIHYSALKQAVAEYAHVDVPAVAIGNGVMPLLAAAVGALGLRTHLATGSSLAHSQENRKLFLRNFCEVFMPSFCVRRYVASSECMQRAVHHKCRHLTQAG